MKDLIRQILKEELGIAEPIQPWVNILVDASMTGVINGVIHGEGIHDEIVATKSNGDEFFGTNIEIEVGSDVINDLAKDYGLDIKTTDKGVVVGKRFNQHFPLVFPNFQLDIRIVPSEAIDKYATNASFGGVKSLSKVLDQVEVFSDVGFTFTINLPEDVVNNENDLINFLGTKVIGHLRGIVQHELTHAYQAYNKIKNKGDITSVDKSTVMNAVNSHMSEVFPQMNWFFHLLYVQLPHELGARVPQAYEDLLDMGTKTKEDFKNNIVKTSPWKEANDLMKFDATEYYNSIEIPEEMIQLGRMAGISDEDAKLRILNSVSSSWEKLFNRYAQRAEDEEGATIKRLNPKLTKNFKYFLNHWDGKFKDNGYRLKKKLMKLGGKFN